MRHCAVVAVLALTLTGCVAACNLRINGPGDDRSPTAPSAPVVAPTIHAFTADATRLGPPNGATLDTFLRWDVSGSADTHCRIDSPGQPSQNLGNVALGGFAQVRPGISRDYLLSCTNAGGTVVRTVSIIVS
jgi:hypothetical protein